MEAEPFKFPEPFPEQFVAFIDVLGFSDLVFRNQHTELQLYFRTVTDILQEIKRTDAKIQSINISDSIILVSPGGLQGFKRLIKAVRRIQRRLLFRNILIRGAIAFGEVYFDDHLNIIVGKGYIRAYLLEREAIYPRVIIDPAIMKVMDKDRVGFLELINDTLEFNPQTNFIFHHNEFAHIPNDAIFVDYAYTMKPDEPEKLSEIIGKVYNNIRKNLYSEQKLYAKYDWLRNYYRGCIEQTIPIIQNKARLRVLEGWKEKFERL